LGGDPPPFFPATDDVKERAHRLRLRCGPLTWRKAARTHNRAAIIRAPPDGADIFDAAYLSHSSYTNYVTVSNHK